MCMSLSRSILGMTLLKNALLVEVSILQHSYLFQILMLTEFAQVVEQGTRYL